MIDGDALVLVSNSLKNDGGLSGLWYTSEGGEIFDLTGDPQPYQYRQSNKMNGSRSNGRYNEARYGALWNAATGRRLVGSHHFVSHGMSMTRRRALSLILVLSGINTLVNGVEYDDSSESLVHSGSWVMRVLQLLCDGAAITGFSEYWYYSSWAIYSSQTTFFLKHPPAQVRKSFNQSSGPLSKQVDKLISHFPRGSRRRFRKPRVENITVIYGIT